MTLKNILYVSFLRDFEAYKKKLKKNFNFFLYFRIKEIKDILLFCFYLYLLISLLFFPYLILRITYTLFFILIKNLLIFINYWVLKIPYSNFRKFLFSCLFIFKFLFFDIVFILLPKLFYNLIKILKLNTKINTKKDPSKSMINNLIPYFIKLFNVINFIINFLKKNIIMILRLIKPLITIISIILYIFWIFIPAILNNKYRVKLKNSKKRLIKIVVNICKFVCIKFKLCFFNLKFYIHNIKSFVFYFQLLVYIHFTFCVKYAYLLYIRIITMVAFLTHFMQKKKLKKKNL